MPAAILFGGMFFFPKSPRWLASKDRWEEALHVLANLHGGGDVNHPKVLAEYKEIEEALRFEREQAVTSFKALTEPRMFKRVFLGMSVQAWSQLCVCVTLIPVWWCMCSVESRVLICGLGNEHNDVLHCK